MKYIRFHGGRVQHMVDSREPSRTLCGRYLRHHDYGRCADARDPAWPVCVRCARKQRGHQTRTALWDQ